VVLFVAHQARSNPFKDYPTMRASLARLAGDAANRDIHFIASGKRRRTNAWDGC